MKIIFPQNNSDFNNSLISIIIPAVESDINEIADKDVPVGKPYIIVNDSDIPSERTYRSAWRANFDSPDGYGLTTEEFKAKYPNSIFTAVIL